MDIQYPNVYWNGLLVPLLLIFTTTVSKYIVLGRKNWNLGFIYLGIELMIVALGTMLNSVITFYNFRKHLQSDKLLSYFMIAFLFIVILYLTLAVMLAIQRDVYDYSTKPIHRHIILGVLGNGIGLVFLTIAVSYNISFVNEIIQK
jgi:hypothetical protein